MTIRRSHGDPLVDTSREITLAVVGKQGGNDHPYSWAAIVNGYRAEALAAYADPVIIGYLERQQAGTVEIEGARVTHVWCDDPADAAKISRACLIPEIVDQPEDVIGEVDAVMVPVDIASQHVSRILPFIEAGLPVLLDKPLATNLDDLETMIRWVDSGHALMSCSTLRFSSELQDLAQRVGPPEDRHLIVVAMTGDWERYGIHALEGARHFFDPHSWRSVRYVESFGPGPDIIQLDHSISGTLLIAMSSELTASFGHVQVYSSGGHLDAQFRDRYAALKKHITAFVHFLRSGNPPFPFSETEALSRLLIGGLLSKSRRGSIVNLSDLSN